jgi:hypothetical protein
MFRITKDPSSGNDNLYLTEITFNGSNVLIMWMVGIWRHIATACGLDGPKIKSRWWRDFPHLSRPALRPTQPPVQWVPGLSWVKAAGA